MPVLLLGLLVLLMVTVPTIAWGYVAGQPVELELGDIGRGFQLRADAADAFQAMAAAARADGVELYVNSAFRTLEQQKALEVSRAGYAAPAGYSNHQAGTAVDIESAGGTNAAHQWLAANGPAYGFHSTVAREPWHWEFLA